MQNYQLMKCNKVNSPEKRVVQRLKAVLHSKRISTNLATPSLSEMQIAGFETKMEISETEIVDPSSLSPSPRKNRYADKENILNVAVASAARTLEDVSPLVPKGAGKKLLRVGAAAPLAD